MGDVDAQVGDLQLAGSIGDALVAAPAAKLEAPLDERIDSWIEDEPAWTSPLAVIDALASSQPPPAGPLVERWKALALGGLVDLIASVLNDYIDRCHAARLALRTAKTQPIAPLVAESLKPDRLAVAVRAWQPITETAAT